MEKIQSEIYDFSVNNKHTKSNLIIDIAEYLCDKYDYQAEKLKTYHSYYDRNEGCEVTDVRYDSSVAWDIILKASRTQKDVYALATVLFYRVFPINASETDFYVKNESILLEMVELLNSIKDKDGFVYFLIGRSYMVGRGVEIDLENAIQYLNLAYENGIDIAKLFVCDLENDWDKKAKYSKDLIEKYPNNHIVKYYYGLCHYAGCYVDEKSKIDYSKVFEVFNYTMDWNYSEFANDLYFFQSRYILGLCYFFGKGVEKNIQMSYNLFKNAKAKYMPDAKYAEAITHLLINKNNAKADYVFNLLKESALAGYLPAVRKIMLCLRIGFGTDINNELYEEYKEFFDHYKDSVDIFSDLGEDADKCPLFSADDSIIIDEECLN